MNVADRMTKNPFSVTPESSVSDARELMKRENVRRLPVVNDRGELMGIVTEKDILCASPSPASTLDVWEITALLARLKISDVMTPQPISVAPDTPVEQAVRLIADHHIGGLPITEGTLLTGIITESDLFEIFIELFAIRRAGLRITFLVPDVHGELAALARSISDCGGDILSLGFVRGENAANRLGIAKVSGLTEEQLSGAVSPFVQEIREIREIQPL